MSSKAIADLKAVRKRLHFPESWGQGSPRPAGCICLVDAINETVPFVLYEGLATPLRETLGMSTPDLDVWNDAPERTHSDVLKLLDETVARLEREARVTE